MLTKLIIKKFKGLPDCEIELGQTVVFVGPNNSGKTTALQALSLWETGMHTWMSKRPSDSSAKQRVGVTINRKDLISIPLADTKFLWQNQSVRIGAHNSMTKQKTENIHIHIIVEGIIGLEHWSCGLEFDYSNSEVLYCRPIRGQEKEFRELTNKHREYFDSLRIAMLPPMSGLASVERKLELGSIDVLVGEGQTAQVLRNLCFSLYTNYTERWEELTRQIITLFGIALSEPQYDSSRGELSLHYCHDDNGRKRDLLEISSTGRGTQQVLLILTFLYLHPQTVILLDEPDAHLEILRQKQIFETIKNAARKQGGQVIAATHSEAVLNESAEKDIVIAFLGKPHRLNDRQQLIKSLNSIGWEQYLLAQQKGWVLYLEGSTDLDMLRAFAKLLNHPVQQDFEIVFMHSIDENRMSIAENHFYALREAVPDLKGFLLLDRVPEARIGSSEHLIKHSLKRRELENYFCSEEVLLNWAKGKNPNTGLFRQANEAEKAMRKSIAKIEESIKNLKPEITSIWAPDLKASDDILTPILNAFFNEMNMPAQIQKARFHELIPFMKPKDVDKEIIAVLDTIHQIASNVS